jgi:hypothetical protein
LEAHQLLDQRLSRTPLEPGKTFDLDLPGGWHLHLHVDRRGQHRIETYDVADELVGFVASTDQPLVAVGAAWRWLTREPTARRWWTLAIGHATLSEEPQVTFTSRSRDRRLLRTVITPVAIGGLWMTVVPGRHGVVAVCQGSQQHLHRVSPTISGRP